MTHRIRTAVAAQRGAALFVMAVVVVLIGGLALGLLGENMAETRSVDQQRTSLRALEVAEAGIARAQAEVQAQVDLDGDGIGNLTHAFGGGTYEVTAAQSADNPDRWTLVATGTVGLSRRRIEVGVRRRASRRHVEGLYSKGTLDVGDEVTTDAYDSRNGSYATQAVNTDANGWYALAGGHVGSGQGIVVSGATAAVRGNAIPGPGYQTQTATGSVVTGDTMPRERIVDIADPTFSEFQGALASNDNAGLVATEAYGADEAILSWINDSDLRSLTGLQVDGLSLANLMLLGETEAGAMRFDELLGSNYCSLVQVPTTALTPTVDGAYVYYSNASGALYPEKYRRYLEGELEPDSDDYWLFQSGLFDGSSGSYSTTLNPPAGRVSYDPATYELRASAGAAVVLEGGTYFFSDIRLTGNAYLVVRGAAEIYVTGRLDLSGGAILNTNGKPGDLCIIVHPHPLPTGSAPSGSYVKIRGGSIVAAALYAPSVPVSIGGSGHYYGSIVGQQIDLADSVSYHYDEALRDSTAGAGPRAFLERLYWRELSAPPPR